MSKTRLDQLSPEQRKLLALRLKTRRAAESEGAEPAAAEGAGGEYPLSYPQQRLWMLDRLQPGSAAYNVPSAIRVRDTLRPGDVERAIDEIVRRHGVLRTRFEQRGAESVQVVEPHRPFALPVHDLRGMEAAEAEAELTRIANDEAQAPFDLAAGPPFRARMATLGPRDHTIFATFHHIVTDGWSNDVFWRELSQLVAAYEDGTPYPLQPLPMQFGEYARRQRERLSDAAMDAMAAWWKRELDGAPHRLELPTDRPRPAALSDRGGHVALDLPAGLADRIARFAVAEEATPFMVLLAAYHLLLGRSAGTDDVLVGSAIGGRTTRDVEPLIGFFANTLAIRGRFDDDPSFRALVARVRRTILGAYEHQEMPFDRLVDELGVERTLSGSPLVQTVFLVHNRPPGDHVDDGTLEALQQEVGASKFDVTASVVLGPDRATAGAEFSADLFDAATLRRMLVHYGALLDAALADPDAPVSTLAMLAPGERDRVLTAFAAGPEAADTDRSVHALFAAQAAATPARTALSGEGGTMSFAALDAAANRLAHHLRASGVRPGARVGVMLERGPDLVVTLLAALKAGAAYVPLDPSYPAERLAWMMADARVDLLVTDTTDPVGAPDDLAHAPPSPTQFVGEGGGGRGAPAAAPEPFDAPRPPVLHLSAARAAIAAAPDTDPGIDAGPDALAYVVYTSGSTGTPKGVAVPHRGIVRLVRGGGFADLGPDETFLQLAPASFDAATLEVWAPLLNGGRLALAPAGTPTPRELAEIVRREGVTTLWLTAGLFHLVATEEPDAFAGVRQLLAGGDVLSPAHLHRVREAHPGLRVINGYGPTENTTFTACRTITEDDLARASVPIGSPIAGTTAYVVDRRMAPAAVGVPGELVTGGDGLAWGYLGRPGLTAERFVPDPFGAPGSRLYRTGDRVRWLEDGGLEFLGRMDQQVKVRGFRIEPGEVEAALKAVPGVRDAVVVARADGGGEKRLVAYVVGADGAEPSAAALRDALAPRLPAHMIPSAFVALEEIPLTPNGKVDRRALPAPAAPEADGRFAAPRTPTEEVLAGAWAELLGLARVGVEDDFFLLGGHSLIATQVVSRVREAFGVELPLRALFEAPVLSAFAARVDAAMRDEAGMAAPPLVRVPGDDLPLSFAQERLWFIDRLEPGSPVYNMPFPLRLRGALDVAALERAMGEVVRRHESLRTRFPVVDGAPVQRIEPFDGFALPVEVLEGDEDAREAEAAAAADAWTTLPFDLAAGPLFRARLLRIAPEDHLLLVGMHHVVSDGWSMGVFWRELITLYHAFRRGEPSPLPPLPLRYADFAAWQRAWLSGETLARQVAWWRDHLAGAPALLAVPTDRPRPPTQSHRGAGHAFALPPEVAEPLRALARAEGATLFMALLAAWDLLLSRWSGQDDVVVGTPVAGRTRRETEGMIGFFVNTLAIRADLSGDPSFRALLHRVREATLGAYAHQDLPFERLVEELQPERSLAHAPVYQVMLVLQNLPEGPTEGFEGVEIGGAGGHTGVAKVDLTLGMMEAPDGGLAGAVEYATDLFDEATAARMSRHLANLLAAAVADPDAPVSSLAMLDAEEREAVRTMGGSTRAFAAAGTLHERFAARAARTPDAVAVTFGREAVTFGALDARADALARRLRARGAGPEVLVGLCVERSVETVVGILGILEAGAAYLPLDPAYPADRLAYMLEDSGAPIVVTTSAVADRVPAGPALLRLDEDEEVPDDARPSVAGPESLAYVIYTSGSTGRPKGVQVTHGNVLRLFDATDAWFGFGAEDAWTLFHSYAFDFSVWELWGALLYGGRLVVVPFEVGRAPAEFLRLLADARVTVLNQTPSAFRQLMQADADAAGRGDAPALALREVIFGGEALDPGSLRGWVERRGDGAPRLVNMYGITETTVHVTFRVVRAADVRAGSASPIGIPIPDLSVHVRDARGDLLPLGIVGEMHVGGAGVARGYLGRPALTAERFVPDPFGAHPGARLYRSGDLARRRPDGSLEFFGRADDQVKVRGFRIELGEIETVLREHPAVREAVVLPRGAGDALRLVAWVVGGDVSAAELRAHLLARVPEYMVPSAFVAMDALPLTRNGKVDRRALPDPDAADLAGAEYVAPRTETEARLAAAWAALLGVDRVGAEDGFFDLGGHSLLATRVVSRVREDFGVELPVRAVFEHPVLAALAAEVDARKRDAGALDAPPMLPVERGGDLPLSFAQERLWFIQRVEGDTAAYHMPFAYRLTGALDAGALRRAVDEVVRRHESLRTRFPEVDGIPVQRIDPPAPVDVPLHDLSQVAEDERDEAAGRIAAAHAGDPFDLAAGPLFRAALVRLAPDDHLLLVNLHHVISDGWSTGILWTELSTLYGAFAAGDESPLPEPPLQYADFAAWQRAWLTGEALERQLAYWRGKLAGAPPLLDLPTDRPRPPVQRHRGAAASVVLDADAAARVHALARAEGVTLFMVLLAGLDVVLARLSGQDDVVVGTPIAGRTRAETEGMIGLFLNSLALRTDLSGDLTFAQLLARVREATLEAYAHQDLPFERILEEVQPARSLAHAPVFQVMLNLANFGEGEVRLPGLEVAPLGAGGELAAKFDLTVYAGETPDGGLYLHLVYDADLFDAPRMEQVAEQLVAVLDAGARDASRPLSSVSLVTESARGLLPDPAAPLSPAWRGSVPALFAAHAARTPDAVAVEDPGERWTYAELDAASARIANRLVADGVRPGDVVAIHGHRSAALVRALLGTLRAGAAFLVLDPAYPAARLAEYVAIARPRAVLALAAAGEIPAALADALREMVRLTVTLGARGDGAADGVDGLASVPADAPGDGTGPDSLAYLSFTSGTTGRPKAVMGRHGSLTHFTPWLAERFGLGPDDRFSLLSGLAHDPLHRDVFTPLQLGAAVVAPDPAEVGTPGYLAGWLRERRVTVAHLTPAMGQLIVDLPPGESAAPVPSLRRAFFVGDVLTRADVERLQRLAPSVRVVNYYGSTETQRAVAYFDVPRDLVGVGKETVPVGRGIPDVQVLVRAPSGALAGVGEVGEIWMRSPHVALGYLGDDALTAERFAANPWTGDPADRMYRTGDLGRYRADGVVEIAGRADQQVKIRGFRVEPGEVEAVLRAHPAVRDVAVVARGDRDARHLAAYVVAAGDPPDAATLREWLRASVPDFMLPAGWAFLPALPVTPNGKVDRRALPEPEAPRAPSRDAPRSAAEAALAEIWAALLPAAPAPADDDFFALGGHSLLATRLAGRVRQAFGVALPLRTVFEAPTLGAMAAAIERLGGTVGAPDAPAEDEAPAASYPPGVYPLTHAQQRLWVLMQLGPTPAYNLATALRLTGPLDDWALERALDEIVRRHEILRSRIEVRGDEPVQVVGRPRPLRLRADDITPAPGETVDDALVRLAGEEAARPFPAEGPFLRVRLLRAADDDHVVLWTLHHLAGDGWSVGVFQAEMAALYAAFARDEASPLAPLPLQYGQHALEQRRTLSGAALERLLAWWTDALAGAPALLELPADRPRPAEPTGEGASFWFGFPEGTGARVAEMARAHGATPYMVLLSAFQALLSRWSGQNDVVVGTPIANRTRPELEPLIGLFANTLALRADVSGDPSFAALLERVREVTLGAYDHQDVPFERLVEALNPERSLAHAPVFQVMFALQNATPVDDAPAEMAGVTVGGLPRGREAVKYDLSLYLYEHGGTVAARLEYASALFDAATMERFAEHLVRLLDAALADPARPLSSIPLTDEAERAALADWNRTPCDTGDSTVLDRFEGWAARTPDAPALAYEDEVLTYRGLDARAGRVARALAARGIGAEDRVGLCAERSADAIVGMLAVMKAGAAYVPFDPALPAARIGEMLADAGASLVLAQAHLVPRVESAGASALALADAEVHGGDAAPLSRVGAGRLAYVIYTSGSTGRPKGVAVEHRQLAGYVAAVAERVGMEDGASWATVSTLAADLGHTAVFGALCGGGCLHIVAAERVADADAFAAYLARHPVDGMKITPSHLAALAGGPDAARVLPRRWLVLGGEASDRAWVGGIASLAPALRIVNHYGPTEATVGALAHPVDGPLPETPSGTVPIGRPLANARAYVLDAYGNEQPVGLPGELAIGGRGVARGYLGRPAPTAERFVPDPFAPEPGARMYRTGDRARRLRDGALEFLGRIDQQVKVRGFRVEPGEVESVLRAHPGVRDVAVLARPDAAGTLSLVAWVVPLGGAVVDEEALRRHCADRLPAYMVPSAFVPMEALPLTPNGKLDRRALPDPEPVGERGGYVAPRTPAEEMVAAIWAELLRVERVGARDGFFALGGHSLLGTRVVSRLRERLEVEVPLAALFEAPRLDAFAARVDEAMRAGAGVRLPPIPRTDGDTAPLSFAQERLWFIDRLDPGAATYNMAPALRLRGRIDEEALEAALAEVVRRHEPLRTALPMVDGAPVQRILPPGGFRLERGALPPAADDARDEALARVADAWAAAPFDLEAGPLFRARLVRIGPEDHALLLGLHHAVSDGWSNGILLREIFALYNAFAAGRPSPLPPLPIRYADYAAWQRAWLAGEPLARQLAWWRARLEGAPALLELPLDHPRPAVQSPRGAVHAFDVPPEAAGALRGLAREEGATLFMALLAAWSALLSRWSGQDDVVVGTPVAGRTRRETEDLVGLFVNTLALRTRLEGDPGFRPLLRRVREATLGAFAHADLPFEKLVEELRPERSLSHAPVFQAMFVLQNTGDGEGAAPAGLRVEPVARGGVQAKVDLALTVAERPDGALAASLTYAADLFDAASIAAMGAQLVRLLHGAARQPDAPVASLPLADSSPVPAPDAAAEGVAGDAVHRLFEAQAARTPEATAVVWSGGTWSYAELDARADAVAARLREAGAGPERVVAVLAEYGPEAAAALLGVLKSGAAYLPLDAAHPAARLAYVLEDSGAVAVLAAPHLRERLPEHPSVAVVPLGTMDGPPPAARTGPSAGALPESAAYVIYTSGSTGLPKAVVVPHAAACVHAREVARGWGLTPEDRVEAFAALTFDPSLEQFLAPLLAGASVAVRGPEVEGTAAYVRRVRAAGVTVASPSAGYWAQLVADDDALAALRAAVRLAVVGGEAMAPERAARWYAAPGRAMLVNAYGPTEAVVEAAAYRVPPGIGDDRPARVPIGAAVGGRTLHVLDGWMRPVAAGVPGELFVGGLALGRGYLRRPALTAERFVPDPFAAVPGARMYRTGDRVRHRADGMLEFLGRVDQQVKVRGFRIEPGEVEAALRAHPGVRDAAVAALPDAAGTLVLVAYVVGEGGAGVDGDALHRHCAARLPAYMVPSAFVALDALPLTPGGKVDRRALPTPERAAGDGYVVPRDVTELEVARIWAEVLGVPRVGAADDFFRLGGHSLLALRMMSRVRARFGVELPLPTLFQRPSVAGFAAALREGGAGDEGRLLVTLAPGGERPPVFFFPPAGGTVTHYAELARLLGEERPFHALQAPGVAGSEPPLDSVEAMAGRFLAEIRRVRPHGPYVLGGWSAGGTTALEVARRLRADGEEVAVVALLDTLPPDPSREAAAPDRVELIRRFARSTVTGDEAALDALEDEMRALADEERLPALARWIARHGGQVRDDELERVGRVMSVFAASARAVAAYALPAPYDGPVALFVAAERPPDEEAPLDERWRPFLTGPLTVHTVPGVHAQMVLPPAVEALAAELAAVLDGATAER